jgi:hypothetical protein
MEIRKREGQLELFFCLFFKMERCMDGVSEGIPLNLAPRWEGNGRNGQPSISLLVAIFSIQFRNHYMPHVLTCSGTPVDSRHKLKELIDHRLLYGLVKKKHCIYSFVPVWMVDCGI